MLRFLLLLSLLPSLGNGYCLWNKTEKYETGESFASKGERSLEGIELKLKRRCLPDTTTQIIACVDDSRRREIGNGSEILIDDFYRKCEILDSDSIQLPIQACADEAGNRFKEGELYKWKDSLYYHRCELRSESYRRPVGCADEMGRLVAKGEEFRKHKFLMICRPDRKENEIVACLDKDGYRIANGSEFISSKNRHDKEQFVYVCNTKKASLTKPVACVDSFGQVIQVSSEADPFLSLDGYFYHCRESTSVYSDGLKLQPVGCSTAAGTLLPFISKFRYQPDGVAERCKAYATTRMKLCGNGTAGEAKYEGFYFKCDSGTFYPIRSACVSSNGTRAEPGEVYFDPRNRWHGGNFYTCDLNANPYNRKALACADKEGRRINLGEEFRYQGFWRRCSSEPIAVACALKNSTDRIENGTEFLLYGLFHFQCRILYRVEHSRLESTYTTYYPVACADQLGNKLPNGSNLTSPNGHFKWFCYIADKYQFGDKFTQFQLDPLDCLDSNGDLHGNNTQWMEPEDFLTRKCLLGNQQLNPFWKNDLGSFGTIRTSCQAKGGQISLEVVPELNITCFYGYKDWDKDGPMRVPVGPEVTCMNHTAPDYLTAFPKPEDQWKAKLMEKVNLCDGPVSGMGQTSARSANGATTDCTMISMFAVTMILPLLFC